ncbi:MAG: restriction endonuclease subunit S [Methylococcaceae bacterium]
MQIRLGDSIQIQKGKKPIGLGPKSGERTVPYINISAFETKHVEEYAPEQDVPRCAPIDTLLVWDGARAGLAGRGIGGFIGSTLSRLTSDLADPGYLYYFVHSNYGYMNTHTKGVGIPHIDPIVLAEMSFPLPPSTEQTRIVAKIEELLTDLDAGAAELKAAQKKLGQYRQSLLKAAVEGALTAEWRAARKSVCPELVEGRSTLTSSPDHPSTGSGRTDEEETGAQLLQRILIERRARWEAKQLAKFAEQGKAPPKDWQLKYPEPVQPDTSDLPTLPKGWVWSSIGQCFHVAVGATPSRKEPSYWGGSIPWVSSGEVRFSRITATKEMITDDGLNNSSTQINPIGSVLLGMIGEGKTRGQVAILDVEAANNQNCAAIWVGETGVPSEYVYYWLWSQYEQTRRGSSGNNQPALNKSIVERILFPLAPLDELQESVRLVDSALDSILEQEAAIEISLKQSAAQRKNILKAAFSGQLVPQDPSDEPAGVLLERIRAERVGREAVKKPRGRKTKEAR